jgi:hypothetical protein
MRLSPLFGTAIVLVVLGLLAIPLHRLTGSEPAAFASGAGGSTAGSMEASATPAIARIRLLRDARSIELRSDDDTLLWKAENVPAGETEAEVRLGMMEQEAVVRLRAEFADDGAETAVFVTLLPDGLEERSAHAIGRGSLSERLVFTWPPHATIPEP